MYVLLLPFIYVDERHQDSRGLQHQGRVGVLVSLPQYLTRTTKVTSLRFLKVVHGGLTCVTKWQTKPLHYSRQIRVFGVPVYQKRVLVVLIAGLKAVLCSRSVLHLVLALRGGR